ncbi:MAG TPA: hypothetical protein VJV23_04130 [Candidatus Polarisedimenticolia bacterium]|nr:hypothetical protein [Candidatus Polarisedimenticolia bacterium]
MRRSTLWIGLAAVAVILGCGQAPQDTQVAQADAATNPPVPAQQDPPAQQQAPVEQARPAPVQQAPPQQQAPRPSAPPPAPRPAMATVPSGTVLALALDSEISSKTAQVGDEFTATVVEAVEVDGRAVIPAGSTVHGKVTEAVAAKRGAGNAKLAFTCDRLTLKGGYKTGIVGTFQEVSESKKKRNAAIIGGSAAGGALLGRILGKDTKGAVVGSILGGGIGTAVVMGQEGEQVVLPADTPFEIRLDEAVKVPAGNSKA